jgi:hypothetical protein
MKDIGPNQFLPDNPDVVQKGNYLEHSVGFLWCTGKRLFGIDDILDGILNRNVRIPDFINQASIPYWHLGNCWKFGCDRRNFWIDPCTAKEEIRLIRNGETTKIQLNRERIQFQREV